MVPVHDFRSIQKEHQISLMVAVKTVFFKHK